jgi:hypothetical protein
LNGGATTGLKAAWFTLGALSALPLVAWVWWMLTDNQIFVILGPVALTVSLFVGTIFVFMGFQLGLRYMYIWTVLLIFSFTLVSPVFWLFNCRAVLRD